MTSKQMTENKGKEPSRSDNVVYDQRKTVPACRHYDPSDEDSAFVRDHLYKSASILSTYKPQSEGEFKLKEAIDELTVAVMMIDMLSERYTPCCGCCDGSDVSTPIASPISSSDANLAPADAILRDDEK